MDTHLSYPQRIEWREEVTNLIPVVVRSCGTMRSIIIGTMLWYVKRGQPLERWAFRSCDLSFAPVPNPTSPWQCVGFWPFYLITLFWKLPSKFYTVTALQCGSVRGLVATWKKQTWVSWLSNSKFDVLTPRGWIRLPVINPLVESLTGKIYTWFLLAELWLWYYYDMIVWFVENLN